MKRITFWFDIISPYAYLAFEHLPQALRGLSYQVDYQPVLLAGLTQHHGQRAPFEVPGKRDWVARQTRWLARRHSIPFDWPAVYPFDPLPLLRLAVACATDGRPNRYVAETLLRHVWRGGADVADPHRLRALAAQLVPAREPGSDAVKDQLKAHGRQAVAQGLFGVPAMTVRGKLFWGLDALPMLRGCLEGDAWFDGPAWDAGHGQPAAAQAPHAPHA